MYEIPDSGLKVHNVGDSKEIYNNAIIVTFGRDIEGNSQVIANQTGIVGIIKVSKEGVLGHGTGCISYTIHSSPIRSDQDVSKCIESYNYINRMTQKSDEKNPISIIEDTNPYGTLVEASLTLATSRYKSFFCQEHDKVLKDFEKSVIESVESSKEIIPTHDSTRTVYYTIANEDPFDLIKHAGKMSHPGQKHNLIRLCNSQAKK